MDEVVDEEATTRATQASGPPSAPQNQTAAESHTVSTDPHQSEKMMAVQRLSDSRRRRFRMRSMKRWGFGGLRVILPLGRSGSGGW